MSRRLVALVAAGLILAACGGGDGGDAGAIDEPGDTVSLLGNAAMDEFLSSWDDYIGFYNDNLDRFDPTTASSWQQWVRQARQTSEDLLERIDRLAVAYQPLPPLIEAEIAAGGVPADEEQEMRELITAYGTWIEYERKENLEFLECIELDPADVIPCLNESAATTTAKGDEVARRIYELQETLFGVTPPPGA